MLPSTPGGGATDDVVAARRRSTFKRQMDSPASELLGARVAPPARALCSVNNDEVVAEAPPAPPAPEYPKAAVEALFRRLATDLKPFTRG